MTSREKLICVTVRPALYLQIRGGQGCCYRCGAFHTTKRMGIVAVIADPSRQKIAIAQIAEFFFSAPIFERCRLFETRRLDVIIISAGGDDKS
jgi:hypothetical protein